MAQTTFGGWTFGNPDPQSPIAFWYDGNGNVSFTPPDAVLKAAAKGPNAVQDLMWITGGDFSRVKQLGLLGDDADWNALGQMGAEQQAKGDSDFTFKEISLPTALVLGTALGAGPALESAFGLGGAEAGLTGAAGTEALMGAGGEMLSEAELAALIESGTVGAEGAALEASALGSAAGGATAGGAAGATSGGGAGAAEAAAGGTALSRTLGLDQETADLLELLGIGGATVLGVHGAGEKADALTDIANQSREDRSQFLNLANKYLADPNAWMQGPGKAAGDAVLRGLSVKGNPVGIPSSLDIASDAAMRNWLNGVSTLGNLGLSGEDTRAQLMSGAVGADADRLNAIGAGLADVTKPKRKFTLNDIYNASLV